MKKLQLFAKYFAKFLQKFQQQTVLEIDYQIKMFFFHLSTVIIKCSLIVRCWKNAYFDGFYFFLPPSTPCKNLQKFCFNHRKVTNEYNNSKEWSRNSNMNKIACKNFRNFLHRELCMKKSAKIYKCVFHRKKQLWFKKKISYDQFS